MFGNALNCTQSPGGKRLGLVYVNDNIEPENVFDAVFGMDLWSLLSANLSLDDDPGHATFGKWKIKTDGPQLSNFIFDIESSNGKPCFFIPIFDLTSEDKHFNPSQWAGDYPDYKCVVKNVTFGMYNYNDSNVVPFTVQCLVVYAKGATPNPYANPLVFDNPLPKMGKKWKYKNQNGYVRNNYGALNISHCTIETEIEFEFDTTTQRVVFMSEKTKVEIPSMISADVGDYVNNIVGAMKLNPDFGSYPRLNNLTFDHIPMFGEANKQLSEYNFTCNVQGTNPDLASTYQNPLGVSYVEADDFRIHFQNEFGLGFLGYALQMPQHNYPYNNVIAEFVYPNI